MHDLQRLLAKIMGRRPPESTEVKSRPRSALSARRFCPLIHLYAKTRGSFVFAIPIKTNDSDWVVWVGASQGSPAQRKLFCHVDCRRDMHRVLHIRLIWPSFELVAKKVRLLYFTKKKSERLRCLEVIKLQDQFSSRSVMYDKWSYQDILASKHLQMWISSMSILMMHLTYKKFCIMSESCLCLNHVVKKYLHWFYTLMKATWLVLGVGNSRHCGRCRDSSNPAPPSPPPVWVRT